jgi:hypothetical protein
MDTKIRTSVVVAGALLALALGPAVSGSDAEAKGAVRLDDPSAWGEWIADVERPAEEYRGRYQPSLSP